LKLKNNVSLSNFAFNYNLRRYISNSYRMFNGATAWLAKFERTEQSDDDDGPPSSWKLKA